MTCPFGGRLLTIRGHRSTDKCTGKEAEPNLQIEVLALRHQLRVLERQVRSLAFNRPTACSSAANTKTPLDRPQSIRVTFRQGADRALQAPARRAKPVTARPLLSYRRMCQKTQMLPPTTGGPPT